VQVEQRKYVVVRLFRVRTPRAAIHPGGAGAR
jgi:hypothetical protein